MSMPSLPCPAASPSGRSVRLITALLALAAAAGDRDAAETAIRELLERKRLLRDGGDLYLRSGGEVGSLEERRQVVQCEAQHAEHAVGAVDL